ncbi:MAG: ParB/RepB/Spo0J family partition protein [Firmicutes bacterium]|nr:ParB/RepB/Spo0J family partition protein [Bacillota bacterium]
MKNPALNISLTPYDDIFKTDEERNTEEIKPVAISELKPFESQPFKVLLDESMDELVESIKQSGVLSPIIARPHKDGGYEILSGHRRVKACELAGISEIPVVVKKLDDDTATILLVDSNLQRENILPSEKAFAYQLKLEAIKRQGARTDLTSSQVATKLNKGRSDVELGEQVGESKDQIRRYIRLTNLIDPLLEMVDEKKIALNAAVEISYLGSKEQAELIKVIEKEETSPSIAQASKIRKFAEEGRINVDVMDSIMQEQKPKKVKITFKEDKLRKYFPKHYSAKQMEDTLLKLLEDWHRKKQREHER